MPDAFWQEHFSEARGTFCLINEKMFLWKFSLKIERTPNSAEMVTVAFAKDGHIQEKALGITI